MNDRSAGRAPGTVRRALTVAAALGLAVLVTVSAERAQPAPTRLGSLLGIDRVAARLDAVSDTIAVAHRTPSAADLAFVRRIALAEPLSPLPYYIAAANAAPAAAAHSRKLVALALERDPRLRPAWSWMVADRAGANDVRGMTRALIRLAVLNPGNQQLWPAIAQVSADPAARAFIRHAILDGAPWRDTYLTALSASPVDRAVVFEMLQAVGRHAPATTPHGGPPDDRGAFLAALVARQEYERAYLAWVQWLPAASQGAVGHVFDGDFKGLAALPPFAWRLTDGVGGATTIDPGSGLSLDYSGTDGAVIAEQMLLLGPGRYRLATQANFQPVSNENGLAPLAWNVTCLPDGKPLGELAVPLDGAPRRVAGAPFEVAQACAAQTLVLKVNSADFAKRLSGRIRSISVEAVK